VYIFSIVFPTHGVPMRQLVTVPVLITLLVIAMLSTTVAGQPAPVDKAALAAEVKAEFVHTWNAYKTYAWGHDGLRPLSKIPFDWYSTPLYLGPLEALDTMILMGMQSEADSTREFIVRNLSFDKDIFVKVFEINIRVVGSLLANYQLTGDERLLTLAKDLADRLIPAFKSPTGIPYAEVNLKTGAVRGTKTNPGEAGTLLVEFGTLSMLTHNSAYYNYAKNAYLKVFEARSAIGLVGEQLDCETGEWLKTDSHLSACIDSYYEYMVKCALLFDDEDCKIMWRESYMAINNYLLDSTTRGVWYGHADMNTGKRTKTWFGALDAFFPAVMALAGDVHGAADLMESCFHMWKRHGLEPEQFDYVKDEAASPRYLLSPEIMESAYYLYRKTNDPRYLEMGKVFLDSLKTYCRVDAGYAEINNLRTKEKLDRTETYFYAETLKYLYLLFAPPETLDFDKIIFNSEAHPIRRTW
jgi:mannosidase alpha-like ER degradation enhancer 2